MTESPSTDTDPLDAALAAVEDLGDAPLAEHADAFERVHAVLHEALREADGSDAGR